jgi:hypothetical protein
MNYEVKPYPQQLMDAIIYAEDFFKDMVEKGKLVMGSNYYIDHEVKLVSWCAVWTHGGMFGNSQHYDKSHPQYQRELENALNSKDTFHKRRTGETAKQYVDPLLQFAHRVKSLAMTMPMENDVTLQLVNIAHEAEQYVHNYMTHEACR